MAARQGAGSMVQRGPGVWRLVASAGFDPVTGKRRQVTRTVHAPSMRAAQQQLARLVAEVADNKHQIPKSNGNITLGELLERWWAQFAAAAQAGVKSPSTARRDRNIIDAYLLPQLGKVQLRKLQAIHLDHFYAELLTRGGRFGGHLAPATVRKVHGILRRALAQAVKWRLIDTNPALDATPPGTAPKSAPRPLAVEDVQRMWTEANSIDAEWACFLRVAAATGARRGEITALRWGDLDLDGSTVTIARALVVGLDGNVVERARPKSQRGFRQVAVDRATVTQLRGQRQHQKELALACGTPLVVDPFVFASDPTGARPWTPSVVTTRFMRLRTRLGLRHVRLHDLRHYVATQLLSGGVDVRTVAGRLGQDPAITLRTYSHFIPARDQEAADLMGRLLDGSVPPVRTRPGRRPRASRTPLRAGGALAPRA
jgi:integrase